MRTSEKCPCGSRSQGRVLPCQHPAAAAQGRAGPCAHLSLGQSLEPSLGARGPGLLDPGAQWIQLTTATSFLLPRLPSRPICRGLTPGLPRLCPRRPELASRSTCPRRQKCTLPLSPSLGVEAHLCFTLFIKQLWSSGSRSGDRPHLPGLRCSANLRAMWGPGHWASLPQTLLVYLPGTCMPAACPKADSKIRFRTHRWV